MLGLAAVVAVALVALDAIPTRPPEAAAALPTGAVPAVTLDAAAGVSSQVGEQTARGIAQDVVLDLQAESDALRLRDPQRATVAAGGTWLTALQSRIAAAAGRSIVAPTYAVDSAHISLGRGEGQGPPRILVKLRGTEQVAVYRGQPPRLVERKTPIPFTRSLEVALAGGRYVIVGSDGAASDASATAAPAPGGHRAGDRHAGRRPDARCRVAGRARLPAGSVPVRDVHGHDGHDGRRALLAGLRRRRLARPLRRQLACGRGHRPVGEARPLARTALYPQRAWHGS